ncbi:hypothetical protein ACEV6Q_18025 [Enterobacter ludwigii]|uniref:hypothetical protein n=1 Tax=Enterobacter ludwigii TaxID=299767 RepID=UPI003BEEF61E
MFDSTLITENRDAFFHYINGKGVVSAQSVVNVVERDDILQGYSLTRRAFRTFKKCRVLKMFVSEIEMNDETIPEHVPNELLEGLKQKYTTTSTGLEICFTGFDAEDRMRLTTIAKQNNLLVRGDISANLYFLCVGSNKGWRKIEKARERGSLIISETQFLEFLSTGEIPYEAPEIDRIHEEVDTSEAEKLQRMLDGMSMTFRTLREPRRSPVLIARFVNGYAAGWRFAVKPAFRDALDIKLTKEVDEQGKLINQEWTQGTSYQFQRGDAFYSDALGYTDWSAFLQLPDAVVLKVKYDCFSGYETIAYFEGELTGNFNPNRLITPKKLERASIYMESQSYDPGTIIVDVLRPDENKKQVIFVEELKMTQDDFVCLLQSGRCLRRLYGQKSHEVDLFKK